MQRGMRSAKLIHWLEDFIENADLSKCENDSSYNFRFPNLGNSVIYKAIFDSGFTGICNINNIEADNKLFSYLSLKNTTYLN